MECNIKWLFSLFQTIPFLVIKSSYISINAISWEFKLLYKYIQKKTLYNSWKYKYKRNKYEISGEFQIINLHQNKKKYG